MNNIVDSSLVLYLPLHEVDGDSFMSRDAYGHLITVTGALWRPKGRLFDGVDDVITVPHASSIDNIWDDGGTAICWANPASDGEGNSGRFFDKDITAGFLVSDEAASKTKIRWRKFFSGDAGYWITDNAILDINTFSMVALTYNSSAVGNTPTIYVNTTAYTVGDGLSIISTPTGIRNDDAANDLTIGNVVGTTVTFDGTIGEVMMFNRELNSIEIACIYLKTKWRYR